MGDACQPNPTRAVSTAFAALVAAITRQAGASPPMPRNQAQAAWVPTAAA